MSTFDWRRNIENSMKDGLIITTATTEIFFGLKTANIKPPKTSLDTMGISKLAGGICGGVLENYYGVYKE